MLCIMKLWIFYPRNCYTFLWLDYIYTKENEMMMIDMSFHIILLFLHTKQKVENI